MSNDNTYDLKRMISEVSELKTPDPPSINSYTGMEGYFENVIEALSIIKTYADPNFDPTPEIIQADLLRLSALHANISLMVGYLQGTSSRAESSQKLAASKYMVELACKKSDLEREGAKVKMTAEEHKAASKILSNKDEMAARDRETVSRMITNAFYAIDSHVQVLRSILKRLTSEQQSTY